MSTYQFLVLAGLIYLCPHVQKSTAIPVGWFLIVFAIACKAVGIP